MINKVNDTKTTYISNDLVNLHLVESCDWSEQCTGSHGANECKVVEGQKICYCPDGKAIIEGICLYGKDERNVNVQWIAIKQY